MAHFNERQRRIYAASLSKEYGYGGITKVHTETGLDVHTIRRGVDELEEPPLQGRVCLPGGGRKKLEDHQPELARVVERAAHPKAGKRILIKSTSRSLAHISEAVVTQGFALKANPSCLLTPRRLKRSAT